MESFRSMVYGETRLKASTDISLERIQFRYKQVRCKVCCGSGVDTANSPMGVRCERCEGTGWRLFPDGPTEKCLSCLGRGKDYRFTRAGTVCLECDGFGEVKLL